MKETIQRYFRDWLQKDASHLSEYFSENIVYSECYGPEYWGLDQIKNWFYNWNEQGTVFIWDITRLIEGKNVCVVEWYFECEYRKEHSAFNGVSIAEFDDKCKIIRLREFQSKKEHYYPYGGR